MNTEPKVPFFDQSPGGTMKVKRILNIFLILKNVTLNKVQ